MREIIYIQAGNYSNYVGTHFWNTQEAYFDYSPVEPGQPLPRSDIIHDISFREGEGRDGASTYCPRLLIFDARDKFGALPKVNDLYRSVDDSAGTTAIGSGAFEEIRQPLIEPTEYQKALDDEGSLDGADHAQDKIRPKQVRFWSDYGRVFYHPRSIQPISWDGDSSWEAGRAAFQTLNEDTGLMEESFRLFVEECDWLQGFQTSFDTESFGSFTLSLIEYVKDEYSKKAILGFPYLTSRASEVFDSSNISKAFSLTNDAFILREAASWTLNAPLTSVWSTQTALASGYANFDSSSLYQTSALLSAHLETATLSLRHRTGLQTIFDLSSKLDWRNNNPFVGLEGALPASPGQASASAYGALLSSKTAPPETTDAQSTVVRCDERVYADEIVQDIRMRASKAGPHNSLLSMAVYGSYPLPSSFPKLVEDPRYRDKIPIYASLTSRPRATATTLRAYGLHVKQYAMKGDMSYQCWKGLERDDLKELAEELVRLADNVGVGEELDDEEDEANDEYEIDL